MNDSEIVLAWGEGVSIDRYDKLLKLSLRVYYFYY